MSSQNDSATANFNTTDQEKIINQALELKTLSAEEAVELRSLNSPRLRYAACLHIKDRNDYVLESEILIARSLAAGRISHDEAASLRTIDDRDTRNRAWLELSKQHLTKLAADSILTIALALQTISKEEAARVRDIKDYRERLEACKPYLELNRQALQPLPVRATKLN